MIAPDIASDGAVAGAVGLVASTVGRLADMFYKS